MYTTLYIIQYKSNKNVKAVDNRVRQAKLALPLSCSATKTAVASGTLKKLLRQDTEEVVRILRKLTL